MNIHFDKDFEQVKTSADKAHPPRLLLHVCCAPCATACLLRIVDSFDVTLFYANDNIYPAEEWQKRLGEVRRLTDIVNSGLFEVQSIAPVKLQVPPLRPERFFDVARGLEAEREGGGRCAKCFELRLGDARDYALSEGFDLFCTTLTISPYKNSLLLNEIGQSLQTDGLRWLNADFKKQDGYKQSIRLCQKYGIYRQHYCGCVFSQPPQR